MKIIDKLKSLFAWKHDHENFGWRCEENMITGKRRAFCKISGGYTPIPNWLFEGPPGSYSVGPYGKQVVA
jgi:hypothetical protein